MPKYDRFAVIESRLAALEAEVAALKSARVEQRDRPPDITEQALSMGINIKPGNMISEPDAATLLGVSPRTMKNWFYGHRPLTGNKLGGRRHYALADIAQFIAERDK